MSSQYTIWGGASNKQKNMPPNQPPSYYTNTPSDPLIQNFRRFFFTWLKKYLSAMSKLFCQRWLPRHWKSPKCVVSWVLIQSLPLLVLRVWLKTLYMKYCFWENVSCSSCSRDIGMVQDLESIMGSSSGFEETIVGSPMLIFEFRIICQVDLDITANFFGWNWYNNFMSNFCWWRWRSNGNFWGEFSGAGFIKPYLKSISS